MPTMSTKTEGLQNGSLYERDNVEDELWSESLLAALSLTGMASLVSVCTILTFSHH